LCTECKELPLHEDGAYYPFMLDTVNSVCVENDGSDDDKPIPTWANYDDCDSDQWFNRETGECVDNPDYSTTCK
jgi:hypothetical protein